MDPVVLLLAILTSALIPILSALGAIWYKLGKLEEYIRAHEEYHQEVSRGLAERRLTNPRYIHSHEQPGPGSKG